MNAQTFKPVYIGKANSFLHKDVAGLFLETVTTVLITNFCLWRDSVFVPKGNGYRIEIPKQVDFSIVHFSILVGLARIFNIHQLPEPKTTNGHVVWETGIDPLEWQCPNDMKEWLFDKAIRDMKVYVNEHAERVIKIGRNKASAVTLFDIEHFVRYHNVFRSPFDGTRSIGRDGVKAIFNNFNEFDRNVSKDKLFFWLRVERDAYVDEFGEMDAEYLQELDILAKLFGFSEEERLAVLY